METRVTNRGCACALGFLVLAACGPRSPAGHAKSGAHDDDESSVGGAPTVKKQLIKNADGTTTEIITTTKWVAAPDPPDRPADPWPSDPLVKYNVDRINAYRKAAGVRPLLYDAAMSGFALEGSKQLAQDHTPHGHFKALASQAQKSGVLGSKAEENQGDWNGVPSMDSDAIASGKKQIDVMLKLMMDEGPGGGHHDNMLNPKMKRVGIGLHYAGGLLYMTNDFSN